MSAPPRSGTALSTPRRGGAPKLRTYCFAISESSGAELWRFSAPGDRELYVGAIGERLVYAVGVDGHVYALRDGTVVWVFNARAPIGSVASLTGGVLYISASSG